MDRTRTIERAAFVGITGNALLAVLKISLGLYTGSLALIGIGLDSFTDSISSLIVLFTARFAAKPPDPEHPYGHGRAETIATKALSFLIFFGGAQLGITTVRNMLGNVPLRLPDSIALYGALVSVAAKTGLFLYSYRLARRVESPMLMANVQNMLGDIFLSMGVLLGFLFSFILNLPLLDRLMACGLSLWIMSIAFKIFLESTEELMEGTSDVSIYKTIFQAALKVPGVKNPHRTRVRKLNALKIIEMDIEVDGKLSVEKGHCIAMEVERTIKEGVKGVYDIVVHVEPQGNCEVEKYGLSERELS